MERYALYIAHERVGEVDGEIPAYREAQRTATAAGRPVCVHRLGEDGQLAHDGGEGVWCDPPDVEEEAIESDLDETRRSNENLEGSTH